MNHRVAFPARQSRSRERFYLPRRNCPILIFFRDSPRAKREKKAAKLSCYSFCVLNGYITVICTARSLPASNFLRSPSRPLIIAVHRLLSIDHGRFHGGAVIMLSLDQHHWIISESTNEVIINQLSGVSAKTKVQPEALPLMVQTDSPFTFSFLKFIIRNSVKLEATRLRKRHWKKSRTGLAL